MDITSPGEKAVSDMIKKICLPILLSLGLFGNVLSIYIFSRKSMEKYTTFRYLLLLSIIDICVLISACGDMMLTVFFDFHIRSASDFLCKSHSFMVIFFTHSSSMILVCMSIDRAFIITIKMSKKLSTSNSATKAFFFVLGLIAVLNLHFLVFTHRLVVIFPVDSVGNETSYTSIINETHTFCYAKAGSNYYTYLTHYFQWVDMFFYVLFPSVVMLICSIIIIFRIFGTNRSLRHNDNLSKKRFNKNKQISYLLLTTNFIFICLVSPLLVFNSLRLLQENSISTTVVYLLSYANHGLNFIFYGISCEKYRHELFMIFKCFGCCGVSKGSVLQTGHGMGHRKSLLKRQSLLTSNCAD